MADRWLVRVGEKEYGPVDLDTLGDWKREGRLLPTNEVRRESESDWTLATTIPGLFNPPPLPAATGHPLVLRRTFSEIIRDSFRVYKTAFLPFFVLTLLIAVPTLALELTSPAYGIFPRVEGNGLTRARIIALIAFTVLVVDWPVFLAGIQIATVGVLEGRKVRLGELLRRAANFFPRFARLSLIVYGSYFLCTAIPVAIILSLASDNPTILSPCSGAPHFGRAGDNGRAFVGELSLLAAVCLHFEPRRPRRVARKQTTGPQQAPVAQVDPPSLARRFARLPLDPDRAWMSAGAEIPLILPKLQSLSTSSPEEIMKMWQDLKHQKLPMPC